LARAGNRSYRWLALLYVFVAGSLATAAFVPDTGDGALSALFLFTLPISIAGFLITYVGWIIAFGPEEPGSLGTAAAIATWTVLAALQAAFACWAFEQRRYWRQIRRSGDGSADRPASE
jgi:hypothetical protein